MEAIVLAGGYGTRLRSLVSDVPKPMAPIGGRPFLVILLRSLSEKGFRRVILSLGFMPEKIQDFFGYRFDDMELDYVIEESPLGTGGAVRLALEYCREDHVFIFNGDTYLDLEVEELERQWQLLRRPIIVGREVPDTTRFGRLITANGVVTGFTEKGVTGAGLINAGCYVFSPKQLDMFELMKNFSLETDYLVNAISKTPVGVFVTKGQFIDIGVPEDFVRAQSELAGR